MFSSLFSSQKKYHSTRTFTYYIPSPPPRKTGYRETEFDGVIKKITSMGFEIISISSQSHANEEKSGLWIICHLGSPTKEISSKEIIVGEDSSSTTSSKIELDPSIIHEN